MIQFGNVSKVYPNGTVGLKDVNLTIEDGEFVAIIGRSGAGKSTLGNVILGNPQYTVDKGSIIWEDEDITTLRTDERAKKGMFMSFQSPIEIPGISISQFIRTAMEANSTQKIRFKDFRAKMNEAIKTLNINPNWINRELNVGFSGGERKRLMLLRLVLTAPRFAILDEPDSGADATVQKQIVDIINDMHDTTFLFISHQKNFTSLVNPTDITTLSNGKIVIK